MSGRKPAKGGLGQGDPKTLRQVMAHLLGPQALGKRRRVNRDLLAAWVIVAGPELASHTRLKGLKRGVLTVEVDSSCLCHHLGSFRREELLLALRERFHGETALADLRFRAGTLS